MLKLVDNMKCIKCGKREAKIGYLCEECYNKSHDLFKIKDFKMMICPVCGRYNVTSWNSSDDPIKSAVMEKIKPIGKIIDIKIDAKEKSGKQVVNITAKGFIEPSTLLKTEKKTIKIQIKKKMCPICIKKSGNYYEALIQIRGNKREKLMKIILDSEGIKKNIVRIKNLKEGYDIFVTDKHIVEKRIKNIKGIKVIKSYKLVGRKKGKPIHRNTYAVRWLDGRSEESKTSKK